MVLTGIHKRPKVGACLSAGLALLFLSTGYAYEVSIPEQGGQAGAVVQVPVILDNAAEVASVQVQINYDAQLLTLLAATNPVGTLGEAFSMQYEDDGGRIILMLYREDHLASGSGVLTYLNFLVNTGAQVGARSDLVVADLGMGNERGRDLAWSSTLVPSNGNLWVVMSSTADSDGDGLSDYEEQLANGSMDYNPYHPVDNPSGGDLDATNPDTDGDGMKDGDESIAGTSSFDPNSTFAVVDPLAIPAGGIEISWPSTTGRRYRIERATNLNEISSYSTLTNNIEPIPPVNTYTDVTAEASRVLFYRIWAWKTE
jgi:Cohesin domain/Bacterial TSP3 repeat